MARIRLNPARIVLDAHSVEHGVYGIVLVSALIGVGWNDETDLEVLIFVVGTVIVFWLAHIYAAVVASRAARPPVALRIALLHGIRHTYGMLVAMLVPALLLWLAVVGLVEEYTAYYLALGSGIVLLALIGYANAARNGSTWPWRVAGILSTTALGLLVIVLSILVH
jgi:positive regulator of sigma E activity